MCVCVRSVEGTTDVQGTEGRVSSVRGSMWGVEEGVDRTGYGNMVDRTVVSEKVMCVRCVG